MAWKKYFKDANLSPISGEKVPNFATFTFLNLINSSNIIDRKSSSKFSQTFLGKPNCIYIELTISFFVKLFLIYIIFCLILSIKFPLIIFSQTFKEFANPISSVEP